MIKQLIKKIVPATSLRWLHKAGLYRNYSPAIGKVYAGDFDRTSPFSTDFGYDRGGPVDRYYIEGFYQKESGSIRGRVLEIGDNEYTLRFGGERVIKSDILHVDDSNPAATLVGDLSNAPHIPDNQFDCIVLAQTLHLIYDFKGAIQTCHRLLKPGGTLLLTVPYITPVDHGEWKRIWYWAFTDKAMQKIFELEFPASTLEVKAYGNVFAASAFLYGMGQSELDKKKLDHHDQHYQMVVSVKAIKA